MASNKKPAVQKAETATVSKTETVAEKVEKVEVKKAETAVIGKTQTVRFKSLACCPEGTFRKGDVREISKENADLFLAIGVAEKVEK